MSSKLSTTQIFILILVILVVLSKFRIFTFGFIEDPLFFIGGHAITLLNILVLSGIIWAYQKLPSPFREIILFILVIWLLSLFGGFLFSGLSQLLLLIILIFVLFALI